MNKSLRSKKMRALLSIILFALSINLSIQNTPKSYCEFNCKNEVGFCNWSSKEKSYCENLRILCDSTCTNVKPDCDFFLGQCYNYVIIDSNTLCVPTMGADLCWEYRNQGMAMCTEKCT